MTQSKSFEQKIDEIKALLSKQKIQSATHLLHELRLARPGDTKVLILLGLAAYKQNDWMLAQDCWTQALTIDHRSVDAHFHLANLYLRLEQYDKAILEYQQIKQSNINVQLEMNLALAFEKRERYWQAKVIYEKIADIEPNGQVYLRLGVVLNQCGQLAQGIEMLERALDEMPKSIDVLLELSKLYYQNNQPKKATQALKRILTMQPEHAEALYLLTKLPSTNAYIKEMKTMQSMLQGEALSVQSLTYVHYGLGKVYDSSDYYERAFFHYQQANQLSATLDAFDLEEYTAYLNSIKLAYQEVDLSQQRLSIQQSKIPVFIVGMSTSGKSLVEKLLIQHPEVTSLGRQALLVNTLSDVLMIDSRNHLVPFKSLSQDVLQKIKHQYLAQLEYFGTPQTRYYCDLAPLNYLYLGLISILFPEAKIIYCSREPLDLCLRNFFHYYHEGHGYVHDLSTMAQFYVGYTNLIGFWSSLGIKKCPVHFESLMQTPEDTIHKVFEYLDLRVDKTLALPKLSTHEIGRWKKYQPYMKAIIDKLFNTKP